jgi:hypothetical protein
MNPAFVGMPMAMEVAEVYYAQNWFYCTTEMDLKEMLSGSSLSSIFDDFVCVSTSPGKRLHLAPNTKF